MEVAFVLQLEMFFVGLHFDLLAGLWVDHNVRLELLPLGFFLGFLHCVPTGLASLHALLRHRHTHHNGDRHAFALAVGVALFLLTILHCHITP